MAGAVGALGGSGFRLGKGALCSTGFRAENKCFKLFEKKRKKKEEKISIIVGKNKCKVKSNTLQEKQCIVFTALA